MSASRDCRGDLWRSHHCTERATVADSFRHGDDVRDHSLSFKSPEVSASPAKARLYFISDTDAAGRTDVRISMLQIIIRKNDAPANTLNRFRNESGDLPWRGVVDNLLHVRRVLFARVHIVPSPRSSEWVGCERVMNAEAVRDVEFPSAMRGQPHRRCVAAMVSVAQGDDVVVAGIGAGHEQGQVVSL